ncbi:hypothetical protein SAMN03159288_05216 [Rhizobium sp. NFACC06-2]|nr:hypothetical protein SAMN03159288_05216 [Rhizobium sp. NFACC06-2]
MISLVVSLLLKRSSRTGKGPFARLQIGEKLRSVHVAQTTLIARCWSSIHDIG